MPTISADDWTDRKLEEMERHLRGIYSRAEKELGEAWKAYMQKADAELERLGKAYAEAKKTGDKSLIREAGRKLAAEKQKQTIYNTRYQALTKNLAESVSKVNQTAAAYINGQLPQIYAVNYNSVAKYANGALRGRVSFDLVDANTIRRLSMTEENLLPYRYINGKKDVRWNVAKINSEVTQGILQGESIPNISKRLTNVLDMNKTSAIRNARTTVTCAENKGRVDMMHDAADKGVIMKKGWSSAHDKRVRPSHQAMDNGEFIDMDAEFANGLEYPGDPDGDPEEVYNCRCSLVYDVVGFRNLDQDKETQGQNESVNIWGEPIEFDNRLLGDEWKGSREIVEKLASEYETRLKEVRPGAKQAAGSVQISGTIMNVSSKDPSVAYHEFAHTLAIKQQDKLGIANNELFWREVQSVRKRYMRETEGNPNAWISAYEHGSNDVNEFMSEAFALSKMRADGVRVPDRYGNGVGVDYADDVLAIIDKYFKKRGR